MDPFYSRTTRNDVIFFENLRKQLFNLFNRTFNQPDGQIKAWWKVRINYLTNKQRTLDARALFLEFQDDDRIKSFK